MCVPTVISSLVNVIYSLADTWFVGMINDPVQSAAVTIASPLMMLFNAVTALFGIGCSSLMSRLIGIKKEGRARRVAADGIFFSVLFGLLFSLLYSAIPSTVQDILGASGENIPYTAAYLKWTVDFVSAGVFQACGMGIYSMMLPILRNAVLEIPAFFILDRLFSVYGLPYAYLVAEGILSIAVIFVLRHIFKKLGR